MLGGDTWEWEGAESKAGRGGAETESGEGLGLVWTYLLILPGLSLCPIENDRGVGFLIQTAICDSW